ncbi:MAG: transcriptional repressor [Alcanivorax sp.]|nr:transcriptional repressor [Alcanivorax sp.]
MNSPAHAHLAEAGLRRTLASETLLNLFMARPGHYLCHRQAAEALRDEGVAVHRVTLYRLLHRLVAAGLLNDQISEDRITRFAWLTRPERRCESHFECRRCHNLYQPEAPDAALNRLLEQLASDPAWQAHQTDQISLTLRGLCARCQEARTC